MKSGVILDILAQAKVDNEELSRKIIFYRDESQRQAVATIRREEIAGMIFLSEDHKESHR